MFRSIAYLIILIAVIIGCQTTESSKSKNFENSFKKKCIKIKIRHAGILNIYEYSIKLTSIKGKVLKFGGSQYKEALQYILERNLIEQDTDNSYLLKAEFSRDLKPTIRDGEISFFDPAAIKDSINKKLMQAQKEEKYRFFLGGHESSYGVGNIFQDDINGFKTKVLIRVIQGDKMRAMIYRLEFLASVTGKIVTDESVYRKGVKSLVKNGILENCNDGGLCALTRQYDISLPITEDIHKRPPIPETKVRDKINLLLESKKELLKIPETVRLGSYVMTSDIIDAREYNKKNIEEIPATNLK